MRKTSVIRPLGALLLALLFLVSNTPRQFMHDLFANHTDAKKNAAYAQQSLSVHNSTYHCQCDNLVVESPFTAPTPTAFTSHYTFSHLHYCTACYHYNRGDFYHYFSLRAPPRNDVFSINVNS